MSTKHYTARHLRVRNPFNPKVLFIGEAAHIAFSHPDFLQGSGDVFATFGDVGPDLIANTAPDIIVSPLFNGAFDAAELAERLDELGYEGRYVVLAPPLPHPEVIERDVLSAGPGVQVEVLVTRSH